VVYVGAQLLLHEPVGIDLIRIEGLRLSMSYMDVPQPSSSDLVGIDLIRIEGLRFRVEGVDCGCRVLGGIDLIRIEELRPHNRCGPRSFHHLALKGRNLISLVL
jgi:hypothetical protein